MPAWFVVLHVRCPGSLGSCSPVCLLGALCCVCGVLGHLAPVHRCARSVRCCACAVSWATWLLFTGVPAWFVVLFAVSWAIWLLFTVAPARCVALLVRCPRPLGSCSPVCPLGVLLCVCAVLGHLAPVHQCTRSVCYFACAVSWPLGSCSPVCPLGALLCVCGVPGHLAPVHRCARVVSCVACAVSWATWLLFTGVPALCVVLCVRCPGPLGTCSLVCPLGSLCCVCGVLGQLAPVQRCACWVRCVACAVSWATWLVFTCVPPRSVAVRVRCPGPLGSCSPVCQRGLLCCLLCLGPLGSCSPVPPLGAFLCWCGVLDQLALVHPCACSVCCFACAVRWATWLLFTGVPARCVALRVRCPGPLGSCSPVCPLRALCGVCGFLGQLAPLGCPRGFLSFVFGVLGHLAPVHWYARSVRCVACAVSWPTWLLFTRVPARCVVLRVRCPGPPGSPGVPAWFFVFRIRCPGPLGSCSLVCLLGALCCVCAVLSHLAPVHRSARSGRCVACAVSSATWLLFRGGPAWFVVLCLRCPGPLGSCSPGCPLGALCRVCRVLGQLAPVHRFARSVRCVACAVSWGTCLLFTGVPTGCFVLRVRCPGPLGSCSPACPLGALCCVCGVLGHSAPVHRCARSVRCCVCAVSWATWLLFIDVPAWFVVLFAVSWATWLLFTGVPARCVVLRVRCLGPLGSCSPVCPLGPLLCVCGVLGHLATVHWCACSVRCIVCALSWATWLLFTKVPARCVVLRVRCPRPLGSCSPACPRCLLCCICGVLGHLAPVHRCARSVRCFAGAVSWATWLLFIGVPARCVVWRVRCPRPLGYCSPVCPLGALLCVCSVLGHLAPVHRCARVVCCVPCAVSWATWLLFTGLPARCVVLRVRCPGALVFCSSVCPLGVLCCVCSVLGHWAPVHRCACSVCCVVCAVSWATWLLFTGVTAQCVVLRVRCPGPLGSCSPVCPLGALCCVCAVLGHLAPVHRCALSVRCCACAVSLPTWLLFTGVPARCVSVACAVSWATWLLFTGVPARCVVLCVRCPGPLGYSSLVCPLGALCCVCGVLGHLAPVHRCARSVRALLVRCPGPLGSCSSVCPFGALCCVCGVLGHLARVHRCACSVRCVVCALSWATWLLFTGVLARWVVLRVRCPGPLGSCSLVCLLGALCCVSGVLGHLAPVHRCACSVHCCACAVSWATWLLFTGVPPRSLAVRVPCPGPLGSCSPVRLLGACLAGAVSWATWLLFIGVPARCVVLRVRCPGPLGSCSPVCLLGAFCCVCAVLGHLAPVRRCACPVRCVACAVSWATWLLFTGVPARCVVLRVRCPGPLGFCSPVCLLGALVCVCGVLGHLAPVHRCARVVRCVASAVSWATWLLFTGAPARCVALLVRCPGPLGSCSPVCPLGALCCVCGVLGYLAPVHRCARSVRCVVCAVSWAT